MNTPETPAPHKLGANRHDPARKRRNSKHPAAESRDVREDRSTRQAKLSPSNAPNPVVNPARVPRLLVRAGIDSNASPTITKAPSPDRRKPVTFKLHHGNASAVYVAGTFNDWNPERHALCPNPTGEWTVELAVEPGRHEYLFVADGCWLPDPNAQEWVENPYGGHNSVLSV